MGELDKRGSKYVYLSRLSMEELLDLLAVAPIPAVSPEKQAYVDALKEAIIEKENENPTGFFPDVDRQWEQFVACYLPDVEETSLEPERTGHAASAQASRQIQAVPQKRAVRFSRVRRAALAAAIAVVCVFAFMLTAQAAGIDVVGAMARWTNDVFSFGHIPPGSTVSESLERGTGREAADASSREFSCLQEALDAYGITEVHEPSWLPEGYVLDSLDVLAVDDPFLRSFEASYTGGEDIIAIGILSYKDEPRMQVEKTDAPVATMEKDGITFYFVKNTSSYTVAWYTGQYEYYISGKLDRDILWEVAASMLV